MRLITDECIIIFSTPDYSYVFILVYFMYFLFFFYFNFFLLRKEDTNNKIK